jgi:tyrosyl-tRNA synthetase
MEFKSDFLKEIQNRGYFNQTTHEHELDSLLSKSKITAYIGFDCTATSLHIGSLIQIMILRYLQKAGHTPLVLLGGGTTKIGDPSGKDEARQLLDNEQIEKNLAGIRKTLEKFDLSKTDKTLKPFKFVNNEDWLKDLNYIDFLRDFGRHFSVNRMLTFDSVKSRLEREHSLSFLEFNYMLLQAYDFYELSNREGCVLQIGGSDQWGNIVNGVELTRRVNSLSDKDGNIFGLTTPLLTTSDGKKMGKTANGAVWLDETMLNEFEYFQYFRNIDDKDVSRFLKLFTELSLDQIADTQQRDINEQKKILAFEAVRICHGDEMAHKCLAQAEKIFSSKSDNIDDLPEIIVNFSQTDLEDGKNLTIILRENELCSSNGEARRLIKGGGVKIDNEKINDESYLVKFNNECSHFRLSLGKKKFYKITCQKNIS